MYESISVYHVDFSASSLFVSKFGVIRTFFFLPDNEVNAMSRSHPLQSQLFPPYAAALCGGAGLLLLLLALCRTIGKQETAADSTPADQTAPAQTETGTDAAADTATDPAAGTTDAAQETAPAGQDALDN